MATTTRRPHAVVVDLILDSDDEGSEVNSDSRTQLPAFPAPVPRPVTKPKLPLRTPDSAVNGRPSSRPLNEIKQEDSPGLLRQENGEPFTKRQRVDTSSSTPEGRLQQCLETQVYPLIEGAVSTLVSRAYSEERRGGIRYAIFDAIVRKDPSFEKAITEARESSPAFHQSLTRKVWQLLEELKDVSVRTPAHTDERSSVSVLPLQTARRPPASILPSIEKEETSAIAIKDGDKASIGADRSNDTTSPAGGTRKVSSVAKTPPRLLTKKLAPKTPQQIQARAQAWQWQSGKAVTCVEQTTQGHTWFGLQSRPYLTADQRQELAQAGHLRLESGELLEPQVLHVDFSEDEIRYLVYVSRRLYGTNATTTRSPRSDLRHCLKRAKKSGRKGELLDAHQSKYSAYHRPPPQALLSRSVADVDNFLHDFLHRAIAESPRILSLRRVDAVQNHSTAARVPSLLFAREVIGNRGPSSLKSYTNFPVALRAAREDELAPRIEWTNCAGDISTISWVSTTQFVCGTTTHSDSHNQQYNKEGNLLLGSTRKGTLQAYPDHRIVRPVVSNGDNALESMVESQDPWLYTSVVDSDYDPRLHLAFTSSFDKTVKVWQVSDQGLELVNTWFHTGRVNFVLASKHLYGMVATGADVLSDAVRVYHIRFENGRLVTKCDTYSCTKIHDEDYVPSEKWGYCPAAMRWGAAPQTQHLLLIGYSPRALSGSEYDVPEDRLNTGELCVWNTITKEQIKVNSAATANVFEVVWHPWLDNFAAATSKSNDVESKIESHVKTQIRIFARNADEQYTAIKKLDCPAVDINEIAIRPNGSQYSYVAAACTDGNVYIWDAAFSDKPMTVLRHDEPIEEYVGDREREDIGVKFIAWGTTADRFYTGSSDGVVKVWNIRHRKGKLVRDLMEAAGPITYGSFSPDKSRLAIGDGSGRVYLLSLDPEEGEEDEDDPDSLQRHGPDRNAGPDFLQVQLGGRQKTIRRPRPFIPHAEVPPPNTNNMASNGPGLTLGQERARGYLQRKELRLVRNRTIGAVQGPNYASTGLFRADAHNYGDISQPLYSGFERNQQINIHRARPLMLKIKMVAEQPEAKGIHLQNLAADFDVNNLEPKTRATLVAERAELGIKEADYDIVYESE